MTSWDKQEQWMRAKKPQGQLLTPVLTRDSMILSFRARVSPCFIFTLFLSKHFMAYLRTYG